MVGVALVVCAPAWVTAQVRQEAVKENTPFRITFIEKAAPAPAPGELQAKLAEMVKAVIRQIRDEPPALARPALIAGQVKKVDVAARMKRFRPILRVEYGFVRAVCDPSKDQRILIARAGLKALDEVGAEYLDWQSNRNGIRTRQPAAPDVRKAVQEALAGAVKTHLSPAQFERYRIESEARAAEQKRVAILNYVANLDRYLVLSREQRQELRESLSSRWDEAWSRGLENCTLNDQYLPTVPEPLVTTILNDDQKKLWSGIQKVTVNSSGLAAGMNMNDGPLDDEFPDEIATADPKPETKK